MDDATAPEPAPAAPATPAATATPGGMQASATMNTQEERQWAMFTHLSALAGLTSIPLANIIAPLILWLVKKDQSDYVDRHGKAAINFQGTVAIAVVALVIIGFPLMLVFIGILFWLAAALVGLVGLVFAVIAGIKASNGEDYQYPLAIPFLK